MARNISKEKKEEYNKKRKEKYDANVDDVRTKRLAYMENWRRTFPEKVLYSQAKIRAERKGLEFDLELSDIVIPELCPILERPIVCMGKTWFSPSLDRIDVSKGYIKSNVRVISDLANTMKNSANFDLLRKFSKNIITYIGDDIVQPS